MPWRLLPLIALLLSLTAHADLIAEYRIDDGQQLTLSYRDPDHIRVQLGAGQLLLVNGEQTLLVAEQGGTRMAVDLDRMGALLGMAPPTSVEVPDADSVRISATGRSETVAGYTGEWYIIDDGRNEYRAVLTEAPDVVELTRAFAQVANRLGKMLGPQQAGRLRHLMDEAMQRGPGGVLRQADRLELLSVREEALPISAYQLPEGVPLMSLPNFNR